MRILYVTNTRFPSERAHSTQIAHMCQAFTNLGHEVNLVATNRIFGAKITPLEMYGFKPKFKITNLSYGPFFIACSKLLYWFNSLWFALHVKFQCKTKNYDLIYVRDDFLCYFFMSYNSKEKIIFESHEARFNFFTKSILKRRVRCVAISEGIRDFYLAKGVSEEQLLVTHDGIDESFFGEVESKDQARARLGIDTDKPVVMYIGGLDKWKGVETFFKASKHCPAVQFVVIGGREEEIEHCQKEYPAVKFLGARLYSELKDNQQAADVLVIPNTAKNNLSSQYTSPLKLFAHLTSGVPLIVSDIKSLRNVVTEEEVIFFQADDPKDLAKKINLALNIIDQLQNKTLKAKELAKKYTWSERVNRIMNFLK